MKYTYIMKTILNLIHIMNQVHLFKKWYNIITCPNLILSTSLKVKITSNHLGETLDLALFFPYIVSILSFLWFLSQINDIILFGAGFSEVLDSYVFAPNKYKETQNGNIQNCPDWFA
jgi:hypothetical protein